MILVNIHQITFQVSTTTSQNEPRDKVNLNTTLSFVQLWNEIKFILNKSATQRSNECMAGKQLPLADIVATNGLLGGTANKQRSISDTAVATHQSMGDSLASQQKNRDKENLQKSISDTTNTRTGDTQPTIQQALDASTDSQQVTEVKLLTRRSSENVNVPEQVLKGTQDTRLLTEDQNGMQQSVIESQLSMDEKLSDQSLLKDITSKITSTNESFGPIETIQQASKDPLISQHITDPGSKDTTLNEEGDTPEDSHHVYADIKVDQLQKNLDRNHSPQQIGKLIIIKQVILFVMNTILPLFILSFLFPCSVFFSLKNIVVLQG